MNQAIYQTQGLNNGPQHILIENANGTQTVQQVIIAQPQGNSNMGINMMQGNNAIILQSKPGPQLPLKKVPQPRQPLQRGNGKKKESPQMIDNSVNIVAHGINSNAGNVSMISNSNMSNQRRQIGKPQLVTQKQGVQSQQISKQQVQMQKQQPHQFQRPANPQNFQNQQSTLQARLKQQPNNIPAHPANEYQVEVTPEDLAVIDTLTKQIILLKAQEQRTGKSEKAKILELEMKRGDIFLNRLGEQHVLDTKVIKDQIYASMPNAGPGAPASTSKPPPKPKAVPKRGSRAAANNESTVKNGPSTSRNHQKQTNNMGNTNIGQSSSKMNVPTTGQLAKSMQKSKQVVSNQQNAFQNDSSQFQSNAASSGMGSGVISSQLNTKNVQGSYLGGNKVNLVQNQVVVVNQPPVKYIPSSETQKKLIDNQRIIRSQQMQQLKNSFYEKTLNPDVTTPFKDIDDAFHRLIPYSVFHEAEPSKETLNLFDHDRLRLRNNHTSRITNFMDKLQSKFLKESVEPTQFKAEHLQLLHMDVEYEKRRLGSEKALANTPEVATIIDKGAAYGIRVDRLDEMHRSLKEKNGQTLASYKFHFNYDLPVNTRQYIPKDMPEGWRTPINTIFDSDNEERDYKKGLSDSDSETDDGKAGDNDNELTESICIDTNGMIDYREPPNIFQPIISPPLYGSGESKHTLSVSSISTKSSCKVKFNLTPLPSISSLSAPKLVVHRGEQIELEATPLMSSAFPPIPKLSLKKVIHPSLLTEPTPSVHSESVFVLPPLKIPKAKLNAKGTTIQHAINSLTTSIPENTSPPARYEDYDGVSTSNGCSNPIVSEKTQIPIASIGEGKVDDNESKVEDMSDKERRRQEKKVRKAKKEEKKERKRVKEMEELNNLNKSISNDSVAATNDCSIVSDSFSDAASTSQPPQRLLFRLNKSELRAEKLLPVMSTTIAAPPAVGTVPLGNEPKVKVPKLKIAREKLHLDPGNSDDSCLKIPPLIVNKPTAHATLDSHLTTHVTLAEPVRTMKEHVRSKAGEHSLLVESKPEAIVSEKKERKKSKERKTIKEPRQSKEHKREKKIKLDKSLAKAATQDDGKVNANDDAPSRLILKLSKLPKLKGEPSIATDVPSLSRSSIDSGSSSVRHKVSESPVPTSDWYKKNPNDNDNLSSVMSNSGKKDQKIKMKLSTPKPEIINVAPAVEDKNSFLSKLEPVKKHGSVVAEPDSSSSSRIDQPPIKMKISIGKKDGKGKEVHKIEEPVVEKIPSLKLSISKARLAPKSNTTPPPIEHRKRKHKETSNDGEEVNADEIERKRKKKEEKKLKKLARLQINGSLIPTE
uniref:GLTSCR1 domain-containing protein n=1 Tax=Rhabditophanes sp. KR3021 TaxID=114890 RepID=A0AC35U3P4_9BILA